MKNKMKVLLATSLVSTMLVSSVFASSVTEQEMMNDPAYNNPANATFVPAGSELEAKLFPTELEADVEYSGADIATFVPAGSELEAKLFPTELEADVEYSGADIATFVPASIPEEQTYSAEAKSVVYDPADYTPEGKSPTWTDSYITRKTTSNGQYYATGYVTVMDGTTPYYHYTTVSLEQGSTTLVTSGRVYGTGKVSATSPSTPTAGDPHLYYGW